MSGKNTMVFDDGHPKQKEVFNARKQAKAERKLTDASTGQIVRHLMYRHRVGLLTSYSLAITVFGFYKWLT